MVAHVDIKNMFSALLFLVIIANIEGTAHWSQLPEEVPVGEVLKKIANGEAVDYNGVTITGDLDLREVSLPKDDYGRKIVTSKICINHRVPLWLADNGTFPGHSGEADHTIGCQKNLDDPCEAT